MNAITARDWFFIRSRFLTRVQVVLDSNKSTKKLQGKLSVVNVAFRLLDKDAVVLQGVWASSSSRFSHLPWSWFTCHWRGKSRIGRVPRSWGACPLLLLRIFQFAKKEDSFYCKGTEGRRTFIDRKSTRLNSS